MWEAVVFSVPLLLACVATVVGVKLLASSAESIREKHIPQTLLIALIALVPVYRLTIGLAGEERAGDGDTCPAINEGAVAVFFISMVPAAAILGGVVVAASLVANPSSWKVGVYALAALVVPYVLGVMYILEAACWLT